MNGYQLSDLAGDFLKKRTPLPLDWEDQQKWPGFNRREAKGQTYDVLFK
jgi:hypothetical protein